MPCLYKKICIEIILLTNDLIRLAVFFDLQIGGEGLIYDKKSRFI